MRIMIFGGFIDYEIQLANALAKQEEVVLILPEEKLGDEYRGALDEHVRLILLGQGRPQYFRGWRLLWHVIRLLAVLPRIKPDIVHIQVAGHSLIQIICFYFTFLQRRPIVSTFHDVRPHLGEESKLQDIFRYFIRKASRAIIVHGVKLRRQMIDEFKLSPRKVHVIPIGEHEVAPFKRYEDTDVRENGLWVLFFGRIYDYKGLDYLIRAEPLISRELPEVKIVIAGAGDSFARYDILIGERRDRFIIHNYRIPYPEGAALFQKSSLVVLPYIEASQSGVVLTAYGFKKPVIATDTGSIPEIVEDGQTGLIVPPGDVEKLAEAVIKLLRNPEERRRMGENGYLKLKTDLSFDSIAEKTLLVYKSVLKPEVMECVKSAS